jgi:hypothetical protein
MATPDTRLTALSTVKAVFEAVKSGADVALSIRKYREDKDTIRESSRVSKVFSTFSDEEVASITKRLEECQKRFAAEGDGQKRAECSCNVFADIRKANGGIPAIDDRRNIFRQVCAKQERDNRV